MFKIECEFIEKLTQNQIIDLHHLFQLEWWTKGRNLNDVKRMVDNSDIIVAYCLPETNELIAFARVLTDYVYKALIFDVMVNESYRKKDLGRGLVDKIMKHPLLKDVKHFELYCKLEMLPFYRKWGFTEGIGEVVFIRKENN
ncbi:GNAT family N-acetyltransferase [Heyndrickxia sporothermodurans]|uniref:GNAT family N-acetyltransferase n=1 Tax=Heyndrickxia sporothermodurans TaxID=46224 RepID=UPI000F860BE8|nr:GNAT family N-acetyltransferase [Bacillus sp. APMAM]RTZ54049.1 N-acetyltransferase [Bacillus sp. SAJ1]